MTKTIRRYDVLMAAFTGKLKDNLAADGVASIEAAIFDYLNTGIFRS